MSNKQQCTCDTPFIDCPHAMEYPRGDKWYCMLSTKTRYKMDILKQLKEASKKRQSSFDSKEWSLPEWGNAISGETGELCNIIKKIHRGDFTLKEANEKELIADEAADIVTYLDLLCQKAGIDLGTSIVNKFNKKSDEVGSDVKIYYY